MSSVRLNTEEALDCLQSIIDDSARARYPVTRGFHQDSSKAWLENGLLDKITRHAGRKTLVFGGKIKELGDTVLHLGRALTFSDNPSSLMRLVGALAYRNLDVLGQLEGITDLVRGAASLDPFRKRSNRPLKDHVLHTACDLDTGYRMLTVLDASGSPIYQRLFTRMMSAVEEAFPGLGAASVRSQIEASRDEESRDVRIRRFVEDCWMATALLHDVGYLHMLGPLLVKAYEGEDFGPSSRTDEASPLYRWLERVTDLTQLALAGSPEQGDWPLTGRNTCLPSLREMWGDRPHSESPSDLHGYVSAYVLLEALFRGDTERPWDSLSAAERCIAVIAASACGFHSAEILDSCQAELNTEDCVDWRKAGPQLTREDNPLRLHLLHGSLNLDRLLARHAEGDRTAARELIESLNGIVALPPDHKTSKEKANRRALIYRAGFRELLEGGSSSVTEALALLGKLDKPDDWSAGRVEVLNRFVLEAALPGSVRSSLEQAWERAWRYNPMGVYLYAVDAIQECVRLVWQRLDRQTAEANGDIHIDVPGPAGLPDGIAGAVGQCPIPEALIVVGAVKDGRRKPGIELYPAPTHLFVTKPTGAYDYDLLINSRTDVQKRRNVPVAMELITGYPDLRCFFGKPYTGRAETPTETDMLRDLAVEIAEDLRRVIVKRAGGVPDDLFVDGAPAVVEFDRDQSLIIKSIEELLAGQAAQSRQRVKRRIGVHFETVLKANPPAPERAVAARSLLEDIRTAFDRALADRHDEQLTLSLN